MVVPFELDDPRPPREGPRHPKAAWTASVPDIEKRTISADGTTSQSSRASSASASCWPAYN